MILGACKQIMIAKELSKKKKELARKEVYKLESNAKKK